MHQAKHSESILVTCKASSYNCGHCSGRVGHLGREGLEGQTELGILILQNR